MLGSAKLHVKLCEFLPHSDEGIKVRNSAGPDARIV